MKGGWAGGGREQGREGGGEGEREEWGKGGMKGEREGAKHEGRGTRADERAHGRMYRDIVSEMGGLAYGKTLGSYPNCCEVAHCIVRLLGPLCLWRYGDGRLVRHIGQSSTPGLDPEGIGRTGVRDDGLTAAAGMQGLTGFARVWLRFSTRRPGFLQSCVENRFRSKVWNGGARVG